jgi:hypothetical protein
MKKVEVNLLEAYEVALGENPYSDEVCRLSTELLRRGLENHLEDIWVKHMADRQNVLEVGCEFDGKF